MWYNDCIIKLNNDNERRCTAVKRIILYAQIKEDMVEEYVRLHENAWPEVLDVIAQSNMHNYSISIRGNELYTYYEYTGNDLEADQEKMSSNPIMQKWQKFTKPCFIRDENGKAYKEMKEIFYSP